MLPVQPEFPGGRNFPVYFVFIFSGLETSHRLFPPCVAVVPGGQANPPAPEDVIYDDVPYENVDLIQRGTAPPTMPPLPI